MGPYLEGGIYTGGWGGGGGGGSRAYIWDVDCVTYFQGGGVYIWKWLIYGDVLTGFYSMLYEVPLKLIALVCLMSLAPK